MPDEESPPGGDQPTKSVGSSEQSESFAYEGKIVCNETASGATVSLFVYRTRG